MTEAMAKKTKREFIVLIERDEDGYYVGTVPQLQGCYTQAKSLDTLMKRVREVIQLCLEEKGEPSGSSGLSASTASPCRDGSLRALALRG